MNFMTDPIHDDIDSHFIVYQLLTSSMIDYDKKDQQRQKDL